jgi:prolyl-tRNA synthetase
LQEEIRPAIISEESEMAWGFIGPYKLNHTNVLFDKSLIGAENFCCGANEIDSHYVGLCIERAIGHVEYHDFAKVVEGGICPQCRNPALSISRGVEVGHIFQLGTKYTESMRMSYLDENGNSHYPIMGCYGIGIGRLSASVCETHHDEYGPIWPLSIAPWQVHLCCVRADDEQTKMFADNLYEKLQSRKIEVIYDDRVVSAGVMFSDADLLGVPIRVIVSPRNMKENCCEIVTRDKKHSKKVALDDVISAIFDLFEELQ